MDSRRQQTIGFIGAGTVATVLAVGLAGCGRRVAAVSSRSMASARGLAERLDSAAVACAGPQGVADACDLVFITTPDDAIEETAARVRWSGRHSVVHCSGALSSDVLESSRKSGGGVASFHPFQTFAPGRVNTLDGATIALEGDRAVLTTLRGLASDLGCPTVTLRPEQKLLYHISGVLACNYVVALANAAGELWRGLGIPEEKAAKALGTLLKRTAGNVDRHGAAASLTGPIARGDTGTVVRHLDELARRAPALLAAYRGVGLLTVPLAQSKGDIDSEMAQELRRLLAGDTIEAEIGDGARVPREVPV